MPTLAIMSTSHPIDTAWRTFWVLKKQRPEPTWARLLITTALGLSIGVILVTLAGLFSGNVGRWAWWRINLAANLVVCLCIAYTMHALYRSLELLLTEAALQRISSWRDWRAAWRWRCAAAWRWSRRSPWWRRSRTGSSCSRPGKS